MNFDKDEVTEDSSGGFAMKHFPDIRLRLDIGPQMKRLEKIATEAEKEVVYGNEAWLYAVKNKGERPYIKIPCPIVFGRGVSNILVVKSILMANEMITGGRGGFFKVQLPGREEVSIRGTSELLSWIKSNMAMLTETLRIGGFLKLTQGEVN